MSMVQSIAQKARRERERAERTPKSETPLYEQYEKIVADGAQSIDRAFYLALEFCASIGYLAISLPFYFIGTLYRALDKHNVNKEKAI